MSAYEGYLKFGSHVIVNNAQTKGIAENAQPCPMYWLRGDVCDTMWDALGEPDPYTLGNITAAPWYDPDVPQSSRFFGFFATHILGTYDSTRQVTAVEGTTHGGTLSRTRKAMKTARVSGLLMGRGRDAIEYGQAWLSASLDPDGCGQVGPECGVEDLEWFVDCPPAREVITEWSPWLEVARNAVPNPSAEVATTHWGVVGAALSQDATHARFGTQSLRLVRSSATTLVQTNAAADRVPVVPDTTQTMLVSVYGETDPVTVRLGLTIHDAAGVQIDVVFAEPTIVEPGGWLDLSSDFVIPANGATARLMLELTVAPQDTFYWVDAWSLGASPFYFDGSLPATEETRFSWVGTAHDSASIAEARTLVERPQTDEEYAAVVDPYRRYLKNAAVVSGPLLGETLNVGDFWAYEVEFTVMSERPWVYGKTRTVNLPPSVPVVVEDITYNRIPYPSAELTSGAAVTVQTNYATNPSVEANNTGWNANVSAPMTATLNAARSTEIAAIGGASFKAAATVTNSGTAGAVQIYQDAPLPPYVAGQAFSISMWGFASKASGTAVLGDLDLRAEWKDAGGATIGAAIPIGTVLASGGAISGTHLVRPPNAVNLRAVMRLTVPSWSTGAVLNLYADALAVTLP